ncbi:MAG: hypothetical protein ACYDA6_02680 [Solirubrobacteraceae bacterium]
MRSRLRENAPIALFAGIGSALLGWLGLYSYAWTNYEAEAQPSFEALVHGHLAEFLRLAPSYGGSLVERAPFALMPGVWGGGKLAVYRMVAVPGLAATAALGVWLVAQMRARSREGPDRRSAPPRWARGIVLGLCVANPISLLALEHGHPEEILGAALCVAAVALAARGRPVWAGLALGLAIANKEWAVVAAGAVLLALPGALPPRATLRSARPRWMRAPTGAMREAVTCTVSTCLAAGAVLAPLLLVSGGSFLQAARGVASTPSTTFLPWSVWWFFGHLSHSASNPFWSGGTVYRVAPTWVGPISHPAVVGAGALLAALAWWQRERRAGRRGTAGPTGVVGRHRSEPLFNRQGRALALLALALLMRCLLDTWDNVYYILPFLIALLAWEATARSGFPVASAAAALLAWASFVWVPVHGSPDFESASFLAWTVPMAVWLALRLYAPRWPAGAPLWPTRAAPVSGRRATTAQGTSVNAFGSELRLRLPWAPRTSRSSRRTPNSPGR